MQPKYTTTDDITTEDIAGYLTNLRDGDLGSPDTPIVATIDLVDVMRGIIRTFMIMGIPTPVFMAFTPMLAKGLANTITWNKAKELGAARYEDLPKLDFGKDEKELQRFTTTLAFALEGEAIRREFSDSYVAAQRGGDLERLTDVTSMWQGTRDLELINRALTGQDLADKQEEVEEPTEV